MSSLSAAIQRGSSFLFQDTVLQATDILWVNRSVCLHHVFHPLNFFHPPCPSDSPWKCPLDQLALGDTHPICITPFSSLQCESLCIGCTVQLDTCRVVFLLGLDFFQFMCFYLGLWMLITIIIGYRLYDTSLKLKCRIVLILATNFITGLILCQRLVHSMNLLAVFLIHLLYTGLVIVPILTIV
jgi:hypothetical protein